MLEMIFNVRHYEFNAKHELTPWGVQNFFQEAACLEADKLGFNDSALHWDLVNTEDKLVTATLKNGKHITIYESGIFLI